MCCGTSLNVDIAEEVSGVKRFHGASIRFAEHPIDRESSLLTCICSLITSFLVIIWSRTPLTPGHALLRVPCLNDNPVRQYTDIPYYDVTFAIRGQLVY